MFGSSTIEVAIGVIFIYLLLSLISTAINEFIASCIKKRSSNLLLGVKNLLNDHKFTGLAQQLYMHGLVQSISAEAANPDKANIFPSYMSSNTFAVALLDILASRGAAESQDDIVAQKSAKVDALQARVDVAKTQLARQPNDKGLQKVAEDAQIALEKAQEILTAANKIRQVHSDADAASKEVPIDRGHKDYVGRFSEASKKLGEALDLGRKFSSEFPDPLSNIRKAVEALPYGHTKESLLTLVDKTRCETALISNQVEQMQKNIEQWFNQTMDRVSGWYKRWSQKVLLGIAIALVFGSNADTIMLAKRLARDSALRASVVTVAEKAVQNPSGSPAENALARQAVLREAESLSLPLGWVPYEKDPQKNPSKDDQVPCDLAGWLLKLIGLLITVFAVSLGAPFWFDTLSKFVNLRGAGTPPGETKKSAPQ
jgi:hypothetical protein